MPEPEHIPDSQEAGVNKVEQKEADLLLAKSGSYSLVYNLIALLLIANIVGRWGDLEFVQYIEFGTESYFVRFLSTLEHEYMTQLLTAVPEAISVISLVVLGVMTLFYIFIGFFAHRKLWTAYKLGWIVYAVDGGITALEGNSISSFVHIVILTMLYQGLRFHKQFHALQSLEQQAELELEKDREELAEELDHVNRQLKHAEENASQQIDQGETMAVSTVWDSAAVPVVDAPRANPMAEATVAVPMEDGATLGGATLDGATLGGADSEELSEAELRTLLKKLIPEREHRYKSQQEIAKGGMGTVYSAKDNSLSRVIAMKEVSLPGGYKTANTLSFIEEARVNALLEHPNIIPVYDIGLYDNGEPYYTMKRVNGEPLADIVDKLREGDEEYTEKFNRITLLQIFIKVCNAISFAHSKGIIHLDIKPENILVGDYGETLVMDWGISQKIGQDSPHHSIAFDTNEAEVYTTIDIGSLLNSSFSQNKGIAGTPMYMAPEQIKTNGSTLDERSDIYALGSVLYNILTLQLPHKLMQGDTGDKRQDIMELLKQKAKGHYVSPARRFPKRQIPSELDAIVNKSMAIDKEERYQSASDLIKDIINFLEDRSVSAHRDSIIKRATRFYRKNTASCSSAALTIFFMTIFGLSLSFYFGKVSRGSKVVYSHTFTSRTAAQSQAFAERDLSLGDLEQVPIGTDGTLRIPARRKVWFSQSVIGSLEMMIDFSWHAPRTAPLYIGFNIKDDLSGESAADTTHYFAALGLMEGELCKLGKQSHNAIIADNAPLYNNTVAVSSRFKMKGYTRYRALIRHDDEVTELYVNGTLVARNYDPMFLIRALNGKIMIQSDSNSLKIHSLKVTKLKDPTLVSPAKLGDKLFALKKFDDAYNVYMDVLNSYEVVDLRREALYKAALCCYSMGDYKRFDSLFKRFAGQYHQSEMSDSLYSIDAQRRWKSENYRRALESVKKIRDLTRRAVCVQELLSFNNTTIPESDRVLLIEIMNKLPEMITLEEIEINGKVYSAENGIFVH